MKTTILLLAAVFTASLVSADPITRSRSEAFELHDALTKLSPGLTPENTFIAADDINALDADAKAYRVAFAKLLQLQQVAEVTKTPESLATFRTEDAKFTVLADEKRVYELKLLVITKEEIKAVIDPKTGLPALSPFTLATIRRLLTPDPKPEKST